MLCLELGEHMQRSKIKEKGIFFPLLPFYDSEAVAASVQDFSLLLAPCAEITTS